MFLVSTIERNLTARRLLRKAVDPKAYRLLLGEAVVDASIKWLPILPGPVHTLVDVGAARGDVAAELDALYGLQHAVLIEPNEQQLVQLRARTFSGRTSIHDCAVGHTAHTASFNVLESVDSSSLLQPKVAVAEESFPGFSFGSAAKIMVKVRPLDEIAREAGLGVIDLLKVDVQGAELDVFRGAGGVLERTRVIHVEVGFTPVYEAQPLFHQVYDFLRDRFELLGLSGVVCNASGIPIQGDATFVNRRLPASK